jgi:hypothetical protein
MLEKWEAALEKSWRAKAGGGGLVDGVDMKILDAGESTGASGDMLGPWSLCCFNHYFLLVG